MSKLSKCILLFFIILVGASCSNNEQVKAINETLEETVDIEQVLEEKQKSLHELEKQDEALYDEMIELGNEDIEKLQQRSKEAIKLLDERLDIKEEEKEVIDESKATFEQIELLIESLEEEEKRAHVEKMFETMMNRYDSYIDVYDHYIESIHLTKELYRHFQEEQFSETKVYALLSNVNDSYDEVERANETFNTYTKMYNELKREYYDEYN
ncbi:MAG TPA: YkyA family protein [Pseudogracilibacillus sp.]|nr:YkyA family protein [Pseudogracilibacillus sp.]